MTDNVLIISKRMLFFLNYNCDFYVISRYYARETCFNGRANIVVELLQMDKLCVKSFAGTSQQFQGNCL